MAGLITSLFGGDHRQTEALVDLLLLAALADGRASQSDMDRIARSIQLHGELRAVTWEMVTDRLSIVEDDGPLFSETRDRLGRHISDPEIQRFALKLAAQFFGEPLEDEEQALLFSVAQSFDLGDDETSELLAPWRDADPLKAGYLRSKFNDPNRKQDNTIFEAIAKAETTQELTLLLFKLAATRSAMTLLSDHTQLASVGETVPIGSHFLRVDAIFTAIQTRWIARFLGKGEALHPEEHDLFPKVLDGMKDNVSVFIGYAEHLAPPDRVALEQLDPTRRRIEKISV